MKSIKNFEFALKELEEIVKTLELGEVDLQKSIKIYQRGLELQQFCETELEKASLEVKMIAEKNGKIDIKDTDMQEKETY